MKFLALALALALYAPPAATTAARAQTSAEPYDALIMKASAALTGDGDAAEINAALETLTAGPATPSASEIAARLRTNLPRLRAGQTVRLPPEVIKGLVKNGPRYELLAARLTPLLRYFDRVNLIVPILYESDVPYIAMMPDGNALVVSTRALDLLGPEDLEAVSAHEICHSVVQRAKEQAVDAKDKRAQRIIELFCDGGAYAVVTALGRDGSRIITALRKQRQVLEVEFGDYERKGNHPTNATRDRLVRELGRRLSSVASK